MNNKNYKDMNSGNLSYADTQNLNVGNSNTPNLQNNPLMPQKQLEASDVKSVAERDLMTIQNLVDEGKLDNEQGQYLVNYVLNKAYNMVNNQMPQVVRQDSGAEDGFSAFIQEKGNFFQPEGRNEVLEYLKNSQIKFDKDELSLISQLIEKLENSAIDRYLKKVAHEKTLNQENEIAKKRLRANAQNSNFDDAAGRVFTREQIGKMSGAEFAKYEKAIMEQLKKGLIR